MKRLFLLALIGLSGCCHESSVSIHFPSPTGFVVDEAGILSQETKDQMTQIAQGLAKNGGPEIAVVTVKSIDPLSIEEYSIRLADQWKVGKKGKDNGIIELLALQERKVRIEVGRGLEGVLNDAKAGEIIRQKMVPSLKTGDYNTGMMAGFQAIVLEIKKEK